MLVVYSGIVFHVCETSVLTVRSGVLLLIPRNHTGVEGTFLKRVEIIALPQSHLKELSLR